MEQSSKEIDFAKRSEVYHRAQIKELERKALCATEGPWEEILRSQYAQLAISLYTQGRLAEAKVAAEKCEPAWSKDFLLRVDGYLNAIEEAEKPLCACAPEMELHQQFSISRFQQWFILHCIFCNKFFAVVELPDPLAKIQNTRDYIGKRTDILISDSKGI